MGMRKRTKNFAISGGILTADFILNLQEEEPKQPLIKPNTFSIPPNLVIKNQNQLNTLIEEAWERLLEKWDEISVRLRLMNELDSRKQWIIPFLKSLGFIDIQYSRKYISFEDDKIQIFISHRGWARADAPKIHVVGPNQELDKRLDTDRNRKSPHDSLQLYLNLDKSHMRWGIVTNGKQIRLLRDFFHTHTRGYVEFDVESILYERNFTDFRTLYRLIHTSRFIKDEENKTILDKFYEKSVAAGSKIGEGLRENVKKAIELIGNGLLTHEVRGAMLKNEIIVKDFYQEILRVIYRILFLMFAEQRGMLPMHNSLYVEEYSITKLRERSETRILSDNHYDLWHGLFSTFSLIREGSEELDVFGYNGDLFDDSNLNHILALNCRNDFLLRAIKYLTLYEKGKVLQRINFLDLGVEEIGAIYESLLDFNPRVLEIDEEISNTLYRKGEFILDSRGAGRKTTGSYYTDNRLIGLLVESALKPVIENVISLSGENQLEKEKSILDLRICDPACGSGAFLIAANNFIGKELAKIRSYSEYPSEREERIARRDVLRCCIYGVDLNPMAIELAKVSLWINASAKEYPLNFLDHHLKCGNSLTGTFDKKIKTGILDDAFTPVKGEDKTKILRLKKDNQFQKKHLKIVKLDSYFEIEDSKPAYDDLIKRIEELEENTVEEIQEKRKLYRELIEDKELVHQKLCFDTWISSFFWPFNEMIHINTPTNSMFKSISEGTSAQGKNQVISKVMELSKKYKFFSWELEFPEVFQRTDSGFDCILGNPPWDRVKINDKEYFSTKSDEILHAKTTNERRKLILQLKNKNPELYTKYLQDKKFSDKFSNFLRNSSLYHFSAKGDINIAYNFTELCTKLLNKDGYMGLILPAGFATEIMMSDFFNHIVMNQKLKSLFMLENKKGFFPDVFRHAKFILLTLAGEGINIENPTYCFFIQDPNELKLENRLISLSHSDFKLINPNTKSCPMFKFNRDAFIIKKIYRNSICLIDQNRNEQPHNISYLRMFDMSGDSDKFLSAEQLIENGYKKMDNKFIKDNDIYLPLYESRNIDQYNHRYASIGVNLDNIYKKGKSELTPISNLKDKNFVVSPRYWVNSDNVNKRTHSDYTNNWFLVYKNITGATSEKIMSMTIIPKVAVGHSLNIILNKNNPIDIALLLANMNSIIIDYVLRKKISGVNLSVFIVNQLPIIRLEDYNETVKSKIRNSILELVYSSHDLDTFANDLGYSSDIFQWDKRRRIEVKCILDSIYAKLYGISCEEMGYILEEATARRRREEKEYGNYLSKSLILNFMKLSMEELCNKK